MSEDCGPCTQLGIDMAERGGADPAVLPAIVAHDFAVMLEEVALVVGFTEATLRHAPEADELREGVAGRFSKRGSITHAFTVLRARMYPYPEIRARSWPRLYAPDLRLEQPP